MKIVNKAVRFILTFFARLLVALSVYMVSLAMISPVLCLALSVMDFLSVSYRQYGLFIIIWCISALILWIPLYIYILIKANSFRVK